MEGVELWTVSLAASPSPVGEMVDVPAAISDYRAWLGSERELLADIERHLAHLATVPLSSFIDFEAVEIWAFGSRRALASGRTAVCCSAIRSRLPPR